MFLTNVNSIHIHAVLKPPLLIRYLHIIPTHLTLPHQTVIRKSPVLETLEVISAVHPNSNVRSHSPICPPPLAILIMPLIPKLNSNLPRISPIPTAKQGNYKPYYP